MDDPVEILRNHRFTCSCGAFHIGVTLRCLQDRVSEHGPSQLEKAYKMTCSNGNKAQFLNTGHNRLCIHVNEQKIKNNTDTASFWRL